MTAFVAANIPSNVDTVEELLVWCASALAEVNPTTNIQTGAGTAEPVVSAQTFNFVSESTDPQRFVVVAYIPLTANWRSEGKIWSTGIAEISSNALPAGYTSN